MSLAKKNLLLIVLVILIAVIPLIINRSAEFGGADGAAEEMITELRPDYEPWFSSIWEPPSGETESLLFSLQAALGAGFIAYFIGYHVGKKKGNKVVNS
ncbi:MAG: energy-coupling factor ABC transporter substrate-binding protein [Bacillota bacterium]